MRWYINRACWLLLGVWLVGFSYGVTSGQSGTALWTGILALLFMIGAVGSEDHHHDE